MASLYELTQNALALQEMLESGEIDEKVYSDTLEGMGTEEKIENVCKMIRNLEAKANAFKEEKSRLESKQKTAENGVKRLKDSLLLHLRCLNKKKVDAGLFTVSLSKTTSVAITHPDWVHSDYLIPQDPKIDKKKIAEDLKSGNEVAGAELATTEYVRIK